MQWVKVEEKQPEENVLYAICYYDDVNKISIPADAFAVLHCGIWFWYVDGYGDEVLDKVTHYMSLEIPED